MSILDLQPANAKRQIRTPLTTLAMVVTRENTARKIEHEDTGCIRTVASQIPEALVLVANIRRGRPKRNKQEQISAADRDTLTRGYQQIIDQIAHDASEDSDGRRRQFVCTVSGCGKVFYQRAHLNIHIRSHTGYKPYACRYPGCGKAFPQLGNMKTHERTHTGDRPFECHIPDCCKAFSQRGNLTTHLRNVHNIATRRSRGETTLQPI